MTKKKVIFIGDDFGRPTGWSIVAKNLISNLDNNWVYEAYFARGKIKEDTEIKSAGILLSYRERSKKSVNFSRPHFLNIELKIF